MIEIRPLELDDVEKIMEIYHKITGRPYTNENVLLKQIDTSLTSLGACVDNELVGYIIGGVVEDAFGEMEKIGLINMVGVDPDHRGKGIGRQLGSEIVSSFKGLGVNKIRTIVAKDEQELIDYFKSLGMDEINWKVLERNG